MRTTVLALAATLSVVLSVDSAAQPSKEAARYRSAAEIPVDQFLQRARYSQIALSPDGRKLAAVAPLNGRDNLVILDIATKAATTLTAFKNVDVSRFSWINNNRLYFVSADLSEAWGYVGFRGAYAIDADGKNMLDMTHPLDSPADRAARRNSIQVAARPVPTFRILSRTFDESGEVIAEIFGRSQDSADVYRYNTLTGKAQILTVKSPGGVVHWVLDRNLVPRIAVRLEPRTDPSKPRARTLWHRAGEDQPWERLSNADSPEQVGLSPIAFDFDNKTLYVSSNVNRDKRAIFKYDIQARKLGEQLVEHPLIDLNGGLIFSRKKKALVGVRYSADTTDTAWFDDELGKLQSRLDKTFADAVNIIDFADDAERYTLIFSQSATNPGAYYLFDTETRSLQPVAKVRDWLSPELMAERRFIKYVARDGLEIPAWLTLPRGSEGKQLPLVVHVHGGPWVRAYQGTSWGRWPDAQFLASRGYAVLEPEPRGSTGFGRKHYMLSMKQWGLTMQDDITDGAQHLVKEGIADQKRMCLYGASYGGYAALQGLVKDPELWRCGIAAVAVTDLELMQTVAWSDMAQSSDFLDTDFKRRVGDKDADREQFQNTSPARNADKIKAPVLLAMGALDRRVPLIHGNTMRDALVRAGNPPEYVVYPDEGHGFNKHENVVDYYTRIEAFLAKHLGRK